MTENCNLFFREPATDEEILKDRIKIEKEHIQRNLTILTEKQRELENLTKAFDELKEEIQKNNAAFEIKKQDIDLKTEKEQEKIIDLKKKIERLSEALQPSKYLNFEYAIYASSFKNNNVLFISDRFCLNFNSNYVIIC